MEYTADLKSAAERIEGSTPSNGTISVNYCSTKDQSVFSAEGYKES